MLMALLWSAGTPVNLPAGVKMIALVEGDNGQAFRLGLDTQGRVWAWGIMIVDS